MIPVFHTLSCKFSYSLSYVIYYETMRVHIQMQVCVSFTVSSQTSGYLLSLACLFLLLFFCFILFSLSHRIMEMQGLVGTSGDP